MRDAFDEFMEELRRRRAAQSGNGDDEKTGSDSKPGTEPRVGDDASDGEAREDETVDTNRSGPGTDGDPEGEDEAPRPISRGGFGGGFGIMEIILIGALLYGIYWFIKRRRSEVSAGTSYRDSSAMDGGRTAAPMTAYEPEARESDVETGLRHIRQMDPRFDERDFTDGSMDRFFQIQGAWANRDMSGIRNLLTDEMYKTLQEEADQLRTKQRINRLDNIAVRSVDITEIWQEGGADFITAKIYANLLDYTTDERTGEVVSGSRTEPVKFQEYWTFTRPVGENPWKLSAIHQAE